MQKTKKLKKIIFIIVAILIILLLIKMFPIFKNIFTIDGRIEFQKQINELGIKGIFVIIALVIAQMFLIFFPVEPVELLAGLCYGSIGGLFLIYLGSIIASSIVYLLVKIWGREAIYFFVSKKKIEKIENSDFWQNSRKIDITLFIAYFIPGTPKGLLTYIGALLPISFPKFIFIIMIARFPEIISSTIVGNNILYGNWLVIFLAYVSTFIISLIIFLIYSKNNKRKKATKKLAKKKKMH